MNNKFSIDWQQRMLRLVFLFILASFVFRYFNHVLLHQLLQPVIFKTESDLSYWIYHVLGAGKLIVQNRTGSLFFDSLLISLCLTTIAYPSQRVTTIAFSILYPFYFLSYNAFVTHHTGTMDGILLITFAFWTVKSTNFQLLWEALRYFNLSIYAIAVSWKLFVGASVFRISQAEAIVKDNLARYLYLNPDSLFANTIYWFLQHPLILYAGYAACVLTQLSAFAGFFTRKYDRLLFTLTILFHIATYFFVDVCYFELLVLNFTFIIPDRSGRFIIPAKNTRAVFQDTAVPA